MARVVFKPRQFKLINGQGNTWDLMSKQSLFINPQGLGYDLNTEYLRVGSVYELIDSYANQKIVSGEMVFASYAVYKQFTEFVNVTPLKLAYMPMDEWAYMDVLTTSIEKTEFQFESTRLICPIKFTGSSKWYIPRNAKKTSPSVDNPKQYTYQYKPDTEPTTPTISGNPLITLYAESGTPSALSTDIEPIQDLHGYDKPWAGGAGKNILETMPFETTTVNGITFTYNDDGSITVNGTATGRAYRYFRFYSKDWIDLNETYTATLSGLPSTAQSSFLSFSYSDNGSTYSGTYGQVTGNNSRQIVPTHEYNSVLFDIPSGQSFTNNRICVQIEKGTESTSWTPYSNICPISGSTDATVTRCGKNLFDVSARLVGQVSTTGASRNGYYTASGNGVATDKNNYNSGRTFLSPMKLSAGTYTISCDVSCSGTDSKYNFSARNFDAFTDIFNSNDLTGSHVERTFTLESETMVGICIIPQVVASGTTTATNIQLEKKASATAYEPYNAQSVTIALGDTIYGGTLDVLTGVLTIDMATITLTGANVTGVSTGSATDELGGKRINTNTSGARFISNTEAVARNKSDRLTNASANSLYNNSTANCFAIVSVGAIALRYMGADSTQTATDALNANPVQIVYELATPTTVQLTPEQIEILEGYNVLTTDADSLTMTYTENVPIGDGYYTYADDLNGVIRIDNNSSEDSPCIITIFGQVENPSWYLTVNNRQIASGSVNAIIPSGHKLVINSNDGELEIAEYVSATDVFVRNLYQNIDFDRETFINVPPGNSIITVTGIGETISAMVEVKELHETV